MAARLATEYKQIEFDLDSLQLQRFIQVFQMYGFRTKTRIFENGDVGDMEFILIDNGINIPLIFRNMGTSYRHEGSYTIEDWNLAQVMQKTVREFKGNALVHRIYDSYRIEYCYQYGKVTHIKELRSDKTRLIYTYQDTISELQHILSQQTVEKQIEQVKQKIDLLLDERNRILEDDQEQIDDQLKVLSKELFILEA